MAEEKNVKDVKDSTVVVWVFFSDMPLNTCLLILLSL